MMPVWAACRLGWSKYIPILRDRTHHGKRGKYRNLIIKIPGLEYSLISSKVLENLQCEPIFGRLQGRSKVDGAIAVLICLGIINPLNSGIGGVIFEIPKNGRRLELGTIVGRETAPLSTTAYMFQASTAAQLAVNYFTDYYECNSE